MNLQEDLREKKKFSRLDEWLLDIFDADPKMALA
jgi:hypothetical protein